MDTNDLPAVKVHAFQAGTAGRQTPVEGRPEAVSTKPRFSDPGASRDAVEGEAGPGGS